MFIVNGGNYVLIFKTKIVVVRKGGSLHITLYAKYAQIQLTGIF